MERGHLERTDTGTKPLRDIDGKILPSSTDSYQDCTMDDVPVGVRVAELPLAKGTLVALLRN